MPPSKTEFHQFVEFATGVLATGSPDTSLDELLKQWREQREFDETVEDLRRGHADYLAGKGRPAAEVFTEIRQRLGISE